MSNHTEVTIPFDNIDQFVDNAFQPEPPALAGNVVASNATEYGLYTTSNGIGTELRTEQGDPALSRNQDGTWQVQPGYQDVIKDEDITLAEDTTYAAVFSSFSPNALGSMQVRLTAPGQIYSTDFVAPIPELKDTGFWIAMIIAFFVAFSYFKVRSNI